MNRAIIAIGLATLIVAALFRVWVHQSVIQNGYAISEARGQRRDLTKTSKALEVERSALRAPDRLQALARKHGMAAMKPDQLFVVQVEDGDEE